MALLTTGNFYQATFLVTTDAAWAALSTPPSGISGALAEAIYKAVPDPVLIYVIDAASGAFAFIGGQAYGFDDTLLNGAAVAWTGFTLDAVDGSQTFWGTDNTGTLIQYDAVAGILRTYSGGEITAFQAFVAAL